MSAAAGTPSVTEISFHFNVPDRTGYACRLLRKAQRQGMALAVTGPGRRRWPSSTASSGPSPRRSSCRTPDRAAAEVPAALHATTVWLAADALDGAAPRGAGQPRRRAARRLRDLRARLIEIVSIDEHDRQAARERWKAYAARGYPIKRHEVAA